MKNTGICPKCQSHHIVEESRKTSSYYNNWVTVKQNWAKFISLVRYICVDCGFTEEWVKEIEDLDKIEKKLKRSDDFDEFV